MGPKGGYIEKNPHEGLLCQTEPDESGKKRSLQNRANSKDYAQLWPGSVPLNGE